MTRAERAFSRRLCATMLVLGCWQALNGGLLHQFAGPPAAYAGIDPAYWLLHGSGLYALLMQPMVASLFAAGIGGLLLWGSWRPHALALRALPILLWPYGLALNAAWGYPAHSTYPLLFAGAIFLWAGRPTFRLAAEGMRYLAAFVFASAAAYKLAGGVFTHPEALAMVLPYQHAAFLAFHPDGWHATVLRWLMDQPRLLAMGMLGMALLQASFVGAFFTRRWDNIYRWLIAFFVLGLWLVMRLDFAFLLVFCPFFGGAAHALYREPANTTARFRP